MEENQTKLFISWYNLAEVKFELMKSTFNREFVALAPKHRHGYNTRYLRCHAVQHLDFLLWRNLKCAIKHKIYNLYFSLATYKGGLPKFGPNFAFRDTSEWSESHHKHIIAYDLLIDIDAGSHKEMGFAHETMLRVIKELDDCKMPYSVRFSGMGFHIIIPYWIFRKKGWNFNPSSENNIYRAYTKILKNLSEEISEMIDIKIADSRRICKIPYSLAFYEKNTYLCMPLNTKTEITNFKLEKMHPLLWIGNLKGRGIYTYNGDAENPKKFLDRWLK